MERRRTPHNLTLRITAEQDNARTHLVDLHAIAVELHLMRPAIAGRHALGCHEASGDNEAGLGHSRRM